MPWMDPEIITLSEVSQTRISQDITYMWNQKNVMQMNLFTKYKYKLTKKTNIWLPTKKAVRRGKLGVWE